MTVKRKNIGTIGYVTNRCLYIPLIASLLLKQSYSQSEQDADDLHSDYNNAMYLLRVYLKNTLYNAIHQLKVKVNATAGVTKPTTISSSLPEPSKDVVLRKSIKSLMNELECTSDADLPALAKRYIDLNHNLHSGDGLILHDYYKRTCMNK